MDEALADGEWHDGMQVIREAMKKITPGVAMREAQRNRANAQSECSANQLIKRGKRSILQSIVNARRRAKSWEVDVWPLPADAWRIGGWRVRDLRARRKPLTVIAEEAGMDKRRARELLLLDPPIRHEVRGPATYLQKEDIPALLQRIEEWRAGIPERRSRGALAGHAAWRARPKTYATLGDLCDRSNMAPVTVRKLQQQHPELPWQIVGRGVRLPLDQLPAWDKVAEEFRANSFERRSRAMKEVRRRRRAQVTFEDPALTATYAQYRAGDTSLKDEVYGAMRESFHRADEAAGVHDADGMAP